MLELFLLCTYFIGHEPEMILFMIYIVMFLWVSMMKSGSYPVYAPHILDVLEASSSSSSSSASAAAAAVSGREMPAVAAKYCGRTIGDIAATCGISLAFSAYFDTRRVLPPGWRPDRTAKQQQGGYREKLKRSYFLILGKTVNAIADAERWWESRMSRRRRSVVVVTEEAAAEAPGTGEM